MDSDMNVTVHEDYSTSMLSTVLFSFHLALQTMSLISSGIYRVFLYWYGAGGPFF